MQCHTMTLLHSTPSLRCVWATRKPPAVLFKGFCLTDKDKYERKRKRKNKGMDWEMWKSHNRRRGCKSIAMCVPAQFPLLRPLLLLLQVYTGTPSPHDCSGTNQTKRITHVSKSSQAWTAKFCPHSSLFFPTLAALWEMGREVFSRALNFLAAVARLIWAVLRPSDPQHALGWKVLCSLSQFCLSIWGTDGLRS